MRAAVAVAGTVLAAPAFAQDTTTEGLVIDLAGGEGGTPEGVLAMFLAAIMEPYAHAVASLALWAILMLVVTIVAVATPVRDRTPSGHPVRDYADKGYRAARAHRNAVEAAGPFVAATVAAILAGASPVWVNWLASLFVVARAATFAVHVWTENQMARSATWAAGTLCVVGLALSGLIAALAG